MSSIAHTIAQVLPAAAGPDPNAAGSFVKIAGISALAALAAGVIFLFVAVKVMAGSHNKNNELKNSGRVAGHLIFGLVIFAVGFMLLVGTLTATFMSGTVQSVIGG